MTTNNKDYTYVAQVEEQIAKKYGKIAAQDFRNGWCEEKEQKYLDQLANRSSNQSKKNRTEEQKNERTCPVCKTYSFSARDDLYMNRFRCCYKCYVDFVIHREDQWREGWRPGEEHLKMILKRRK